MKERKGNETIGSGALQCLSLSLFFFFFFIQKGKEASFCVFLRFKGEQEKEGREKGERRDQKECNFKGKSNEKNGREMKTGEGGAKSVQTSPCLK